MARSRASEAAMAQHGGVLPLNTTLVKSKPRAGVRRRRSGTWSSKHPVITGRGDAQRAPRPGRDSAPLGDQFHAVAGWRQAVRPLHGSQHRQQAGRGARQPDRQRRRPFKAKIEDSGRITGLGSEQEAEDLAQLSAVGLAAGRDSVRAGADHRTVARRRFHPGRADGRHRRAARP